ncbi:unnamed protein product [Somion occarium]|uniref:DNA2/NAM7 helicase-like C-terminal domain-containing protein n=1 Tax=Somion occarium TaxID=3059160 RepID=A0ABP1E8P2_9APHY
MISVPWPRSILPSTHCNMAPRLSELQQDVFKKTYAPLRITSLKESELSKDVVGQFLTTAVLDSIGLSAVYGKKGVLTLLALASAGDVLIIHLSGSQQQSRNHSLSPRQLLQHEILCSTRLSKIAFDFERLSTALFLDCKLLIKDGVDIQSLVPGYRKTTATLLASLGGETVLHRKNTLRAFEEHTKDKGLEMKNLALRAWASYMVSTFPSFALSLRSAQHIDTKVIPKKVLAVLAKCARDYDRLSALKPMKVKNGISPDVKIKNGSLQLQQTRFKTRMRRAKDQFVVVKCKADKSTSIGRVSTAKGKSATVNLNQSLPLQGRVSVYTIGKEDLTNAEAARIDIILTCLQRTNTFFEQPFAAFIFLQVPFSKPISSIGMQLPAAYFPGTRTLNPSQLCAVKRILSNASSDRVCLIQGPPGTGKTTVIAACVHSLIANPAYRGERSIWLVAQSNVAVKNIAEKLVDTDFFNFKLLVSLDFHFGWHEHLYAKLESNVVRTDDISDQFQQTVKLFAGCRVILSTLSMLSNPRLATAGVFRLVPIETVVVDEASQIEIGDYLPLLSKFGKGLRKLAFIGDDKQLAPYGQDDIGDLKSVFEVDHLKKRSVFLDIQYRMPKPIGDFLSRRVYDGKLNSQHTISTKTSCRLADIKLSQERKSGTSWENVEEVNAVIKIAQKYASEGKSYRIITPYDAQRNAIEKALEASGVPWEDRCFNVDSFQGNEADHIIISVVRSQKVGFLQNIRRSNVMLSRCKKSMTICTSRAFLEGVASSTLLGRLAKEWAESRQSWITSRDILADKF